MSRPYNILYLCSGPLIGGAEFSLLGLLEHLDKKLFRPIVMIPFRQLGKSRGLENNRESPGLIDKVKELSIDTVCFDCSKLNPVNPFPYIFTVFKLISIIRKYKIDLIHSNELISNQYGFAAAKMLKVPIITHARLIPTAKAIKKLFVVFADRYITISRAVYNQLIKNGIRKNKIDIIYNGIDSNKFHHNEDKRNDFWNKWNISENTILIGVIGRICKEKGQDIAIKAFQQVIKKHNNVRLILAGDTSVDSSWDYLNNLKRQISDMGLQENVIFTGFLNNPIDFYMGIDILIVPSLNEPFGRILIEAMATGRAVIATNSGGPKEIIINRRNGLLFQRNDVRELSDLICELIDNRSLLNYLGTEAIKRVGEKFDIKVHAHNVEKCYLRVLQS